MECETEKLEITLHSAKGLYDVKHFGTMDPYAMVWIAGDGKESKPRTTVVAIKGGSNPIWNCPMRFNLPSMHKNYSLFCEIKHDGKLFDRGIGQVQVPFADLLAGNGSGEKVSYPVKIHDSGEPNGEIILSHKFTKKNGKEYVDGGPRKTVRRRKKKKGGKVKRIARAVATTLAMKVVFSTAAAALGVGAVGFGVEDILDHEGDEYEDDGDGDEDDGEEDEYEDDENEDEY